MLGRFHVMEHPAIDIATNIKIGLVKTVEFDQSAHPVPAIGRKNRRVRLLADSSALMTPDVP